MSGKLAIVTGAADGIGLAIANRLAMAGATVIGLDRSAGASAGYHNSKIEHWQCDLANSQQLLSVLEKCLQGRVVDVLVNNAGVNLLPDTLDATSEDTWGQILQNNLTSLYLVSKAVIPRMACGAIVNIGSILGICGAKRNAAYAATKGAIISLTKAMARDYGPHIRVNCICPGAVQTAMFERYLQRCNNPEQERERIIASLPLQRLGLPSDIAEAAFFLTSEMSSWITGQVLVVDGGDIA